MSAALTDVCSALCEHSEARRYVGSQDVKPVVGGLGISILTTPQGLMSGRHARKNKVGGELLCEVW